MVLKRITIVRGSGSITADFKKVKGIHYNPRHSDTLIDCLYSYYYNRRPIILVQGGLRREPKAMNIKKKPLMGYLKLVDLGNNGEKGLEIVTTDNDELFVHLLDIVAVKDYYSKETVYKARGYYEPKLEEHKGFNNERVVVGVYKEFKEQLLLIQPITHDLEEIKKAYTIK